MRLPMGSWNAGGSSNAGGAVGCLGEGSGGFGEGLELGGLEQISTVMVGMEAQRSYRRMRVRARSTNHTSRHGRYVGGWQTLNRAHTARGSMRHLGIGTHAVARRLHRRSSHGEGGQEGERRDGESDGEHGGGSVGAHGGCLEW